VDPSELEVVVVLTPSVVYLIVVMRPSAPYDISPAAAAPFGVVSAPSLTNLTLKLAMQKPDGGPPTNVASEQSERLPL